MKPIHSPKACPGQIEQRRLGFCYKMTVWRLHHTFLYLTPESRWDVDLFSSRGNVTASCGYTHLFLPFCMETERLLFGLISIMDEAMMMTGHYDFPSLSREGENFVHASLLFLLAYFIHYTVSFLPFFSL